MRDRVVLGGTHRRFTPRMFMGGVCHRGIRAAGTLGRSCSESKAKVRAVSQCRLKLLRKLGVGLGLLRQSLAWVRRSTWASMVLNLTTSIPMIDVPPVEVGVEVPWDTVGADARAFGVGEEVTAGAM